MPVTVSPEPEEQDPNFDNDGLEYDQPDFFDPDEDDGDPRDDRPPLTRRLLRPRGRRPLRLAGTRRIAGARPTSDLPPNHNAIGPAGETTESKIEQRLKLLRIDREARRRLLAEEQPLPALPEIITLRERLGRPPAVAKWRLQGWLPMGGRAMLVAQFKAGKTTVVGNLVRSLVDGDPWLGVAAVTPFGGTVAVLDFEMSESQLDEWFRDQDIKHDDCVVVAPLRGKAAVWA